LGWPLCTSLSLFAVPYLFLAALGASALASRTATPWAICVLTLAFAIGSIGSMVQALAWLPRPGSVAGKLYRLAFALAALLRDGVSRSVRDHRPPALELLDRSPFRQSQAPKLGA